MRKEKNIAVFNFFFFLVASTIEEIFEEKEIAEKIEILKSKSKWAKFCSREKTELIEEIFTKVTEKIEKINKRKTKESFRKPPGQRIRIKAELKKITGDF